jgi:hypothetical protein
MGIDLFKSFLLVVRAPGFNSRPPCCWNEPQGHHRTARENGHLQLVGGIALALCDFTGLASPVASALASTRSTLLWFLSFFAAILFSLEAFFAFFFCSTGASFSLSLVRQRRLFLFFLAPVYFWSAFFFVLGFQRTDELAAIALMWTFRMFLQAAFRT